jgi:hypothetical protein
MGHCLIIALLDKYIKTRLLDFDRQWLLPLESKSFKRSIHLLSEVSQRIRLNGLYQRLFLVGQRESLAKVAVCQCLIRLAQQCLAELIAHNGCCKKAM